MRFMENDATSLSLKLRDIASQSVGLSGRTLRKLPFLAHALYAQVSWIDQYKEETRHDSHMYLTEPYNRSGGVSLCFTESSDETVFGKRRIYRIKLTFHRVTWYKFCRQATDTLYIYKVIKNCLNQWNELSCL